MTQFPARISVVLLLLAAACGENHGIDGNPTAGVAATAGSGAGAGAGAGNGAAGSAGVGVGTIDGGPLQDAAAADGGESDAEITQIVMDNRGPGVVVIGSDCGVSTWAGISHDGKPVSYYPGCACSCENVAAGGVGCPICEPLCTSSNGLLVPGEQTTQEWNGVDLVRDPTGCYTPKFFSTGDALVANACYDPNELRTTATCEDKAFVYGVDRKVVVPVMPKVKAAIPTPMTIENQTGVAITVVTDHCGTPDWFRLDDNDHQTLTSFCSCSCNDDFSKSDCPSCGQCAEDVTVTIAPGGSYTTTWNGMFWNRYPSGCSQQYPMPDRYPASIQICYTKSGDSTPMCVYHQSLGRLGEEQRFVVAG